MSDIEVVIRNGEKGKIGSNNLGSRIKKESKSRKCMDIELHDQLGDNMDEDDGHRKLHRNPSKEEILKHTESTQLYDFDSDEDTFADAESDLEPNQFYLDEMLEDYHPERLNLFDYRKEQQEKNKWDSSSNTQNDESDDDGYRYEESSTSRNGENDEDEDDSDHDEVIRTLNGDVECESTTDRSDEDDCFANLPTIKKNGTGRQMGQNNIGTSTEVGPGRSMIRQASQKAAWGK
jgi:hypothetical protein